MLLPEIDEIIFQTKDGLSIPSVLLGTRFGAFSIDKLSLGYQTTISWLVNLASRMMEHYPGSSDFIGEKPAVVLVDEIDLHIHPRWQREIMTRLSAAFPNAQFIATSHSPLIVQAAPDVNAVVLEADGRAATIRNSPDLVRGWRIDQILTSDLFGLQSARAPELEPLLLERRSIATKGTLSKSDAARLKELDGIIGRLEVFDNSDDRRALDIIRQAAEQLKSKS